MEAGCACGEWGYKLYDNLYMFVYRSCGKSSDTPIEKRWHIHDIQFYSNITYRFYKYKGKKRLDYIKVNEKERLENVKLDKQQEKLIMQKLREISLEQWGDEFKS
jgi:hypothetical protein